MDGRSLTYILVDLPTSAELTVEVSVERKIGAIARRQHGHITRRQLIALGLGRGAIDHRIAVGKLIVVYPGVYAVGHLPHTPVARAAAAVLACGSGAVLSHGSAAALWGIDRRWRQPFEVTLASGDRRPAGIRTHRSYTVARRDIRRHHDVWVTSPARTLLDIAPRLSESALTRAINDARRDGYLHLAEVAELVARQPHHPGARCIRTIIEAPTGPTRSVLEDVFIAFTRRFGLPMPEINTHVAGYEVDALFRAEGVIVELDSYEFHRDRRSFETDRKRDAVTLANGLVTIRVTWERLIGEDEREAARLHRILRFRRENGG